MKKLFFIFTALALGAFSFSSCSSDDNDSGDGGSAKLPTPAMAKEAITLDNFSCNEIKELELTASGDYLAYAKTSFIYQFLPLSKSLKESIDNTYEYISGKYTKVEDNIYFLEGLGTLQLTKGANNTVEIKLTNLSGTIATGTAEDETVNVTDGKTLDLCRTWYIVQTNFRYEGFTADGKAETPVGAEFPNAQYQTSNDLMAMGEWLMQNYKKDIMEELAGKSYIKNIIFTPKTFAINFGYETYVGDWEWTNKDKGTINYEWEKGYMTTNFDNGEATVSFNDGYATLKLQGDIQSNRENKGTYKLTLTFTLSDKEPIEQPM